MQDAYFGKKIKSNNGQCAYSLIDRYQQHGGEESVERKTQLSVTDQTCKTLFADFTAQEPHLHWCLSKLSKSKIVILNI